MKKKKNIWERFKFWMLYPEKRKYPPLIVYYGNYDFGRRKRRVK